MNLPLKTYRDAICLDQAWQPPREEKIRTYSNSSITTLVQDILEALNPEQFGPASEMHKREEPRHALYRLLIQASPGALPESILQRIDLLLAAEARQREVTHANSISLAWPMRNTTTRLLLWQGDITTLACDAIVNAANSALLGCFRPDHPCIDNAIHAVAGPRLREDCHTIMKLQGHREPTGSAKITRGYHLPASFVLHTVGPIHRGADTLDDETRQLVSSYTCCLDLAASIPVIRNVAFCCIATGIFGFPHERACSTAINTVKHWLRDHPRRFDSIIFNVFSGLDRERYRHQLQENN